MKSFQVAAKQRHFTIMLLAILGVASAILYGYALWLKDLRVQTLRFEWVFFALFFLYILSAWQVLQDKAPYARWVLPLIFGFALIFRGMLIFSQPTLSDDMYRYVWDGRVQAQGINPYLYPPNAPDLAPLRDGAIWPSINRKGVVTIYPAGAQLAFAAIWRIWPDQVHWFQAIMTLGDLIAAALLCFLLRSLGRSPRLVLVYLWNPLVVFEIAHSAHIDGWVLPFLVGAWLARQKGRDALMGLLLGIATALKLYPVLLLPVLWRVLDKEGRIRPAWVTPVTFLAGFLLPYLPYLSIGPRMIGFLPGYFHEQFNFLLTAPIFYWVFQAGGQPEWVIALLIAVVLGMIYLTFLFHPAIDAETALRRCIWPIGAFLLLTDNLFPWYLLWLVPLLAVFLPRRQVNESQVDLAWRLLHTSWSGWWLFSGLVALSYTFFINVSTNFVAIYIQFIPLYEFLLIDLGRWLKNKFQQDHKWRLT